MTNAEFTACQTALGLSNKELAEILGVNDSAVSMWRKDRPVPEYIAKALGGHLRNIQIPLTLEDLFGVSRASEASGLSLTDYLVQLIRRGNSGVAPVIPLPVAGNTDNVKSARVAEGD